MATGLAWPQQWAACERCPLPFPIQPQSFFWWQRFQHIWNVKRPALLTTTSAAYENPSPVITLNAFPSCSMAEIWTPVWTRLPPIVIPSRRQGSRWPRGSFQDSGLSRMPVSQSGHEMSEFENDEAPTDGEFTEFGASNQDLQDSDSLFNVCRNSMVNLCSRVGTFSRYPTHTIGPSKRSTLNNRTFPSCSRNLRVCEALIPIFPPSQTTSRPGSHLTILGSTFRGKTKGRITKEKQVPAERSSSPEVMTQLRQAVFQLSQSSIWEKICQTKLKDALISISSLHPRGFLPRRFRQ